MVKESGFSSSTSTDWIKAGKPHDDPIVHSIRIAGCAASDCFLTETYSCRESPVAVF